MPKTAPETPKTFVERSRAQARATEAIPWKFGQGMVRQSLEEKLVDGLKAFAQLWFLEFTDETQLPAEFDGFVRLIDEWNLADTSDLDDDEDEDDDEDDEDEEDGGE